METAVEWLIEQISKEEITFTGLRAYLKFPELIQQAKQKEKEQMIDLVYHIKHLSYFKEYSKLTFDEMVEHYYNNRLKSE